MLLPWLNPGPAIKAIKQRASPCAIRCAGKPAKWGGAAPGWGCHLHSCAMGRVGTP